MSGTDGYLKIKTKLDNSGVDKDITELENKINNIKTQNTEIANEMQGLKQEIKQYDELRNKADSYKNKIKELNAQKQLMLKENPNLVVSTNSELTRLNSEINTMKTKYQQAATELDKQAPKIDKTITKLEKLKIKQNENNAKISQYKDKIESIKLNKIQNGIDGIGTKLQKTIGKVGKMALAFFGVRAGINAVRSAMSIVAQYNPQIAADIDYIKYALANTLLPIIKTLINFAATLLSYVNAITSAWFGINLFSNSSAKNFQKMQKSASGTAKSMKEVNGSLQSFDEKNVLQDNSDTSSSGGSGAVAPSFDLSNMGGEVPGWLQWIIDNGDVVLKILEGIASTIVAMKIAKLAEGLGMVGGKLSFIKKLGIAGVIYGTVELVKELIGYFSNLDLSLANNGTSWEGFGSIIKNIGIIIGSIGLIVGSIPAIITGVVVAIVGVIIKFWDQIKGFFQNGIDWLTSKTDWVREHFGSFGEAIYSIFTNLLQTVLNIFDTIFTTIKNVFDSVLSIFKHIFQGDFKAVLEDLKNLFMSIFNGIKNIIMTVLNFIKNLFTTIFNGIWNVIKGFINLIIKGLNMLIRGINKIKFDVPDWVPGIGGQRWGFNIREIPLLAKGGIVAQPTMAVVGEQGKEAVMPLENNLEWLDILADKLASRIGNTGGGAYVINLDGRTIQRGIAKRKQELSFATNGWY